MKKIIGILGIVVFSMAMFFNVSLTTDNNSGHVSVNLSSIANAYADAADTDIVEYGNNVIINGKVYYKKHKLKPRNCFPNVLETFLKCVSVNEDFLCNPESQTVCDTDVIDIDITP